MVWRCGCLEVPWVVVVVDELNEEEEEVVVVVVYIEEEEEEVVVVVVVVMVVVVSVHDSEEGRFSTIDSQHVNSLVCVSVHVTPHWDFGRWSNLQLR
ncbi:hypothetical protein E2C01_011616 [Portunus trituberculatus]|uniref:Uncharacterized protein n=1 Tax=Portunus trituberculatus TaxID=210409 RepID=A0A5B7DBL4_PORTR|nr:hypothetical protein [Portunus trituberculatus]